MNTVKLYNGTKVKVKDSYEGADFYLLYDLRGNAIDECRNCHALAYREDLRGGIDDWLCPKCSVPTGEYCIECKHEFVIFPDGEDERDLAEVVSLLQGTQRKCIDCLKEGDNMKTKTIKHYQWLCENCKTYDDGEGIISFCPLHASALELLEALKIAKKFLSDHLDDCPAYLITHGGDCACGYGTVVNAIAKAEGRK